MSSVDADFFADPAVRLNTLIAASPQSPVVDVASICGDDAAYANTLQLLGQKILSSL